MKTLKWLSITLAAALLLSLVVSASWVVTENAIQATSGQEFCSVCHTMKPFAETYAQDVHGGNNPKGLSAACADCHLPHESQSGYLLAKIETGLHDAWAEIIALFKEPDWVGNLANRESYVFNSGCLGCHTHLDRAENQTPTGLFSHQLFFRSEGAMHCVTCHNHVGHRDLLARLSPESDSAQATTDQPAPTEESAR